MTKKHEFITWNFMAPRDPVAKLGAVIVGNQKFGWPLLSYFEDLQVTWQQLNKPHNFML